MQLATYPWTTIDGVEVITATNAESPLPHPGKNRPYPYQNIFDVLLADGRTVVGCAHCEYVHHSIHGVRAHMRKHNQKPVEKPAQPAVKTPAEKPVTFSRPNREASIQLDDVMAAITAVPALQAENTLLTSSLKEANKRADEWKDRALAAETQLDEIRAGLEAISRMQR